MRVVPAWTNKALGSLGSCRILARPLTTSVRTDELIPARNRTPAFCSRWITTVRDCNHMLVAEPVRAAPPSKMDISLLAGVVQAESGCGAFRGQANAALP